MDLPTLTISAANGWMDQKERFSGNIAGKEQKNYTLLHKGELSYNHGNSKLAKYGTVFSLETYEEALVHCRQTLRDRLIPSWLTGAEIDDFEFMVSYQEVKNNEFWLNASCPLCHWYKINPNE